MKSHQFCTGSYYKCQVVGLQDETGTWFWISCLTVTYEKERQKRKS